MERYPVEELIEMEWERATRLFAELKRKGFTIGDADLLIAAQSLIRGYTLVTTNSGHFEHVNGLKIEDWSEPEGKESHTTK